MTNQPKPSYPSLHAALLSATRPQSVERMQAVAVDTIAAYKSAARCLGCGLVLRRDTCPCCE
jgi:hypothetical protein